MKLFLTKLYPPPKNQPLPKTKQRNRTKYVFVKEKYIIVNNERNYFVINIVKIHSNLFDFQNRWMYKESKLSQKIDDKSVKLENTKL